MRKFGKLCVAFVRDDVSGASIVEYGIIAAGIAALALAPITRIGTAVAAIFTAVGTGIQNAGITG